jgi:hypothetical protein
MKIIFLDIDGVLNNDNHIYHYGNNYIDNNLLNLFIAIVKSTESEVVLSSSWKISENKKKILFNKLSKFNIKILDSIIPQNKDGWINTSDEIQYWLKNHPQVSRFAILDDDVEMQYNIEEGFFKTDPAIGLTEDLSIDIIDYVNYVYQSYK